MFLLRVVLNILVRNASPRGPMCFKTSGKYPGIQLSRGGKPRLRRTKT